MVALLWERGARDAALRLEDLWNGLTCRHEFPARSFSLLCAYPLRAFGSREDARRLAAVCEAHDHVRPTARRAHGEARKPGRPRHILVVDDNADAAESLAECLRVMDHSVAVARDGASAIQHALLDSPDLVILDIGLPEMDGYEVARRLRALPQLRSAVFVALTGYAERGDVERALRSGFDHHFAKPLDLPKLAALIGTPRPRKRAGGSARVSVQ
jgi:CheY-like chemotaxis protein